MSDLVIEAGGGFRYAAHPRCDYLYVWCQGTFQSRAHVIDFQRYVEREMPVELAGRAMFDNREMFQPDEQFRAMMWTWLTVTPAIRRLAILLNTVKVSERVERTAALNRVVIRPFDDEERARDWLMLYRGGTR